MPSGLALFAAALLLLIVIGSLSQHFRPGPQGVALTELLAILLPALLFVKARGGRLWRFLRLSPISPRLPLVIVGGVLCGASCFYVLAVFIEPLLEQLVPVPDSERLQLLRLLRPPSGLRPLWQDLLYFAAVPALCEEVLFRGVLLAVLATTLPATRRLGRQGLSVLLCALLFGLFHLSWSKLLPTALLGLGFGAAAVWAGSLWPAMSMHFTNNALVVLCVRAGLDEAPSAARSLHGLGGKWLLAGTLAALLGCWLLGQGQPAGQPGKSL